jgi:hypothetical protein
MPKRDFISRLVEATNPHASTEMAEQRNKTDASDAPPAMASEAW